MRAWLRDSLRWRFARLPPPWINAGRSKEPGKKNHKRRTSSSNRTGMWRTVCVFLPIVCKHLWLKLLKTKMDGFLQMLRSGTFKPFSPALVSAFLLTPAWVFCRFLQQEMHISLSGDSRFLLAVCIAVSWWNISLCSSGEWPSLLDEWG